MDEKALFRKLDAGLAQTTECLRVILASHALKPLDAEVAASAKKMYEAANEMFRTVQGFFANQKVGQ